MGAYQLPFRTLRSCNPADRILRIMFCTLQLQLSAHPKDEFERTAARRDISRRAQSYKHCCLEWGHLMVKRTANSRCLGPARFGARYTDYDCRTRNLG